MNCANCQHADAPRVTLIDGTECCNACPRWRHECEARWVLSLPTLAERRAYLYGKPDPKSGYMRGGIRRRRGEAAVNELKNTILAIHEHRRLKAWMAANDNKQREERTA